MITPWDLLFEQQYEEANRHYERQVKLNPEDYRIRVSYATALLTLGRLIESLKEFRKAHELALLEKGSAGFYDEIGANLWMLGDRVEAIKTFQTATEGILNGSIHYADNAGGVSHGLLLWQAGVSNGDESVKNEALRYLGILAEKSRIKWHPGPIAIFVLERKNQEWLFKEELTDPNSLNPPLNPKRADLLRRRELVKLFFYIAIQHRSKGNEELCRIEMQKCANLKNPVLEIEWYLANAEVKTWTQSKSQ